MLELFSMWTGASMALYLVAKEWFFNSEYITIGHFVFAIINLPITVIIIFAYIIFKIFSLIINVCNIIIWRR